MNFISFFSCRVICASAFLFLFPCKISMAGYTLTKFSQTWCTATYPTSYSTVSFQINESTTTGFKKNQTNLTLIVKLPAGFQFNTSAGTASYATAGDISAMSVSARTDSTVELSITIPNVGGDDASDTIFFNNFQVRANSAAGTGILFRNGGTFKIDNLSSNPTTSESLGDLTAQSPMAYSSSSVSHTNTMDVNQSSVNNEILRVLITATGNCNTISATEFYFRTSGTPGSDNPSIDITRAKIYYTGSTSTYSTSNLFGTYDAAPNGVFSITGTQSLSNGNNYFWLSYDIPLTATVANNVDARLDSITIGGTKITDMTTPDPSGKRTVAAVTKYYSRTNGNWNTADIWSNTDNGASCSCSPNGSGYVIIDTNHTITVSAAWITDVMEILNGATVNGSFDLTVNSMLDTKGTGKITTAGNLTVTGNMTLTGSGASTTTKKIDVNGNLTVNSGTSLSMNGTGGGDKQLYAAGNLDVNGTLAMGSQDLNLDGGTGNISGTGSITGTASVDVNAGDKTILSGTNLTISPAFDIEGAFTITNNGIVTLQGNLTGTVSGSTWVQGSSSTLKIGGALLSTGTFTATASGNTVEFNGSGTQTIPAYSFNNLTSSSTGNRTLVSSGSIKIGGTFTPGSNSYTITGSTIEYNSSSSQTITAFNYNNLTSSGSGDRVLPTAGTVRIASSFTKGANSYTTTNSTFEYNGTSSQTATDLNYNKLTISNSNVNLASDISINDELRITGTLNASGYKIILPKDFTNNGTFTHGNGKVVFSGTVAQAIGGTSRTDFYKLEINNSSSTGITLNKAITIADSLVLTDGYLYPSTANPCTLKTSSKNSSGSTTSHVDGPLIKQLNTTTQFIAPVGDSGRYMPAGIKLSAATSNIFSIEAKNTNPNTDGYTITSITAGHINNVSNNQYWNISQPQDNDNPTVRLYWDASSEVNLETSDLVVAHWNGATWDSLGQSAINTSADWLEINNVTSFSPFSLGSKSSGNNPLPIKLLYFDVKLIERKVKICWQSATELNNDFYTIERSQDGMNYEEIAVIKGAGSSNTAIYYETIDESPLHGVSYYRLKQTDFDGKFEYFETVAVYFSEQNSLKIINTVLNNSKNSVDVFFTSDKENMISITLLNYSGQKIWSELIAIQKGLNKYDIDISCCANGFYFIYLENEIGRVATAKFVKAASF